MSTEPRTAAAVENEPPDPADPAPPEDRPKDRPEESAPPSERVRFRTGGPPPGTPADPSPAPLPGAGVLAILAVAWLGATLWVLQREISTSVTDAVPRFPMPD